MSPVPIAITAALPSELLAWILAHDAHPLTLIVCRPRADFLSSLVKCFPRPQLLSDDGDPSRTPQCPQNHLLIPTLAQIATSRHISILYLPSVSHLRAYLAVFPPSATKVPPPPVVRDARQGLVVVFGILELHRDTSEWSAQGLSNTLAGLVEAGWRTDRSVVILEESEPEVLAEAAEIIEDVEVGRNGDRRTKWRGWDERVPMLNGNVKRLGLEGEDGGFSGRTIEVGRILARWFTFGRGEWDLE